jgi:16S rRNA (cytidine1402-2'-O)-methyltransferase
LILYVIATPLAGGAADALPAAALGIVRSLRDFAVENAKSARAFLKQAGVDPKQVSIQALEAGTAAPLEALRAGRPLGLLSEAGYAAVADPGAALVEAAHAGGFRVVPLVGPSSIILGLAASGLEGQRFAFCGYLPREAAQRSRRIRELEARSRRERETEIFIETPYRNDALLAALLESCRDDTRLCIAADLTAASQTVTTRSIAQWRRGRAALGKRPAVFLLLANAG